MLRSSSTSCSWLTSALSKSESASLTEPSEILTISLSASSVALPFSFSVIFLIKLNNSRDFTLTKSNLWHRETTVTGIFLISVVANINFKYSGGSSRVFNKALNACLLNMWTSSIINILYFAEVGPYLENSIKSLISSTPVLLAASISRTSMWLEFDIASQLLHKFSLHILSIPFKQFSAREMSLAVVVFPTPLMPVNKYAFGTLFDFIEFNIVSAITPCPIKSSKVCGLYFKANTFLLLIMN